jgi:hypothetical protein
VSETNHLETEFFLEIFQKKFEVFKNKKIIIIIYDSYSTSTCGGKKRGWGGKSTGCGTCNI